MRVSRHQQQAALALNMHISVHAPTLALTHLLVEHEGAILLIDALGTLAQRLRHCCIIQPCRQLERHLQVVKGEGAVSKLTILLPYYAKFRCHSVWEIFTCKTNTVFPHWGEACMRLRTMSPEGGLSAIASTVSAAIP